MFTATSLRKFQSPEEILPHLLRGRKCIERERKALKERVLLRTKPPRPTVQQFEEIILGYSAKPGAHHQTGIFLVWIYLEFRSPQEPLWAIILRSQARTNVVMSTWCRHVHVRPHCFILTEVCSCRLELAYFAEKISKNRHRQVSKNVVALAYYGSCRLLVTGSCPSLVIQYQVPVSQISWVARLVFHALTLTEYWNGCLWITQQLRNFGFLITEVNKQVFAWSVVKLTSLPFERNFCNFRKRALYINSGWIEKLVSRKKFLKKRSRVRIT